MELLKNIGLEEGVMEVIQVRLWLSWDATRAVPKVTRSNCKGSLSTEKLQLVQAEKRLSAHLQELEGLKAALANAHATQMRHIFRPPHESVVDLSGVEEDDEEDEAEDGDQIKSVRIRLMKIIWSWPTFFLLTASFRDPLQRASMLERVLRVWATAGDLSTRAPPVRCPRLGENRRFGENLSDDHVAPPLQHQLCGPRFPRRACSRRWY